MLRQLALLSLCFFAPMLSWAQTPLELNKITIEQGLPQGYVIAMCQDQEGFMWFGTNDGLCRYDGYEFLVFQHDPYDPFSLSHNGILQVEEVGDFLAISTRSGVDLYDRRTRRFSHLTITNGGRIFSDGNQTLYFSIGGKQLFRLVLTPSLIKSVTQSPLASTQLPLEEIKVGHEWRDQSLSANGQELWLLLNNGHGIGRLNLDTKQLLQFETPDQLEMVQLRLDGANGAWLSNKNTLLHFDSDRIDSPWHVISIRSRLKQIWHIDPKQQILWLEMEGTGGYKLDLKNLPGYLSPADAAVRLNIPEGVVATLQDNYGMVWFGTNAHGIRQLNPRSTAFKNYLPGLSIFCSPFVGPDQNIWLGRINLPSEIVPQGNSLNLKSGKLLPYPAGATDPGTFNTYSVADAAGDIWTSAQDNGFQTGKLIHYRPANGQSEVFQYDIAKKRYFDILNLKCETLDAVWIYLPYRMIRFDRHTRQFTAFDYSQSNLGPSVMAVAVTPDGSHWIALSTSIIRAQPDGSGGFRFTKLQNDPGNRNSLPINNIKTIVSDPVDATVLWIGTAGAGMCRMDTKTNQFTHFNTHNGLPNNVVYGIVPDLASDTPAGYNLWLSTNKGLTKFTPLTGQFQYFLQSDGLPGNEFNTYAYGKMPDGRLIFGGVNGLTIFNPRDLSQKAEPPKVKLTAVRVNGNNVDPRDTASLLKEGIEFADALELPYAQNNLQLQFAALDYAKPERNQFQYYLEGAESEWAHQGFEHSAQYLNLAPGTYQFKVKASNSDGIWNDTPSTLRIVIHPPWYATWWAYFLYLLVLVGAAYFFYKIQLTRRLEHAETIRLQELDQVKTRLYTNITHEFRTPLTVILGLTEQVKTFLSGQNALVQASMLASVQRNGTQLLQLINQLLDLSKLEAGNLTLQLRRGDIVIFLKYVTESFHSYAVSKELQLHFLPEKPDIVMDYDPEKIQMIVANLLSNAIKFSPNGGHIYVQLTEIAYNNETWLSLRVKDTGIGIATEKLPYVFDRFYQADDSNTRHGSGTGIGLALVRELVKLMKGDIKVVSKQGEGAVFTVLLPIMMQAEDVAAFPVTQPGSPVLVPDTSEALPVPMLVADDMPSTDKHPIVLIIEDHQDVAEYVASCVRPEFQVIYSPDGQTGIDRAVETIPDIIISDVMMPNKDGFEVCDYLKNDVRTSHIPIVLLTAKARVEDRITGLRRGADAYLAKPFHPEELRATLSNLLELRRKLQVKYSQQNIENGHINAMATEQFPKQGSVLDIEDVFLQKLRSHIEARISETDLSVEDISRMVGMSYPVVHRKVTALTGLSLTLYVRGIRLQKALILLADPSLSIAEVAYETGFNDPKFFSRVFSEAYGVAPSVYRQPHPGPPPAGRG